jgi:hypothetical protein
MSIFPFTLVIPSISISQTTYSVTLSIGNKSFVSAVRSIFNDKLRICCSSLLQIWWRAANWTSNFIDWDRLNSYRIHKFFFWLILSAQIRNSCLFFSQRRSSLESIYFVGFKLNLSELCFWKHLYLHTLLLNYLRILLPNHPIASSSWNRMSKGRGVGRQSWAKSDWNIGFLDWVRALFAGKRNRCHNIFLVGS